MQIFSEELLKKLKLADSVAVLTGAGISAESGVPTFRDKDGLWDKFNPAELANMDAFMKNPALVWEWYHWRQNLIRNISPNPGHYALAELERLFREDNKEFWVITQNVDALHRKAGTNNLIELHGDIMRNKCSKCDYISSDISADESIPHCPQCKSMLRPDVVWFGEMLPAEALDKAFRIAGRCDLFFSIGTSAVVYPAAMLPSRAKDNYSYLVEINPIESAIAFQMDEIISGKSGEVLPDLLTAYKDFL